MSECRLQRGFCWCGLDRGHEGLHCCKDCGDTYETIPGDDYCDSCGKLCWGEKGTAEEAIKQADGTVLCGECDEEKNDV